ncbi:hypothetical protein PGTUg99_020252 [Puccinia graminis f. sp. tritici]|uniref:21S rRNA pseudouridine(2819) synthase n=1 Tax=Puccinia graminis f. sp. tritici TaxID=56615 RepID=A0A5B0RC39_PUCGR|nr:hypothetical protein PGTUg99_020252 [Puccinia graminis f. sp. tritici]
MASKSLHSKLRSLLPRTCPPIRTATTAAATRGTAQANSHYPPSSTQIKRPRSKIPFTRPTPSQIDPVLNTNEPDRTELTPNRTGTDCKQTKTNWELVTATSNHAIVRLTPQTGRKHQLRLHCSRFLAGPIVGDFKYDFRYLSYQSQKAIHNFLNREAPGRLLLHCSEIEFKLYKKEQPREYTVRVSSPLHDDFRIVCDQLDLSTNAIH